MSRPSNGSVGCGHYGRFVVGDAVQMTKTWYPLALQSLTPGQDGRTWIDALQEAVALCINSELTSASPPLP